MREVAATRRRAAVIAFLLVIVAPLVAVAIISTFLVTPAPGYLEFELEADVIHRAPWVTALAAAVTLAALAMTIRESIGGRRPPQHAPVAA